MAADTCVFMDVRQKGEIVAEIMLVGYFAEIIKPGKKWYYVTFKDAPWADDTVPIEKSFVENRVLEMLKASVKQDSGWKEVGGDLKGFLRIGPTRP